MYYLAKETNQIEFLFKSCGTQIFQFSFIAPTLNIAAMDSSQNSSPSLQPTVCATKIKFYTCARCLKVFSTKTAIILHGLHIHSAAEDWILTEKPCDKNGQHSH